MLELYFAKYLINVRTHDANGFRWRREISLSTHSAQGGRALTQKFRSKARDMIRDCFNHRGDKQSPAIATWPNSTSNRRFRQHEDASSAFSEIIAVANWGFANLRLVRVVAPFKSSTFNSSSQAIFILICAWINANKLNYLISFHFLCVAHRKARTAL